MDDSEDQNLIPLIEGKPVNDRTEPKIGLSVFSVRFGSFRSGSVRSGNTEPKQTCSNRSEKVP